jgi:NAD(P)-dependent dehydrogenase (short-subunit alcohol dehydrogenase family)
MQATNMEDRAVGEAEGRLAVVTGAASGIGEAVARRLLAEGARVLAVDVNERGLAPLAEAGATTLLADLAQPADRAAVVAAGRGAHYLVNSAGILFVRPIFEVGLEEWKRIWAVNVDSMFFLCQGIGPTMPEGGAIVNLSSSSAKLAATIEVAPYTMTKAAVLGVTRSFAYALAPRRVRVNAICPGIVDTPMQDVVLEQIAALRGVTVGQLAEARIKTVPLGRTTSADECAGVIWFLLSEAAAYMTGQAINFTGGLVMS